MGLLLLEARITKKAVTILTSGYNKSPNLPVWELSKTSWEWYGLPVVKPALFLVKAVFGL